MRSLASVRNSAETRSITKKDVKMKTLCSAMRIELEHRHRHQLQVLHQAAEASKCVAELDVDKVKNFTS